MAKKLLVLLAAVGIAGAGAAHPAAPAPAPDDPPDVVMRVDGLACPFCAYGLEKKLKKVSGVEAVDVELKDGLVLLTFAEGRTAGDEALAAAVRDSGFRLVEICRPATESAEEIAACGNAGARR